jgi:hypothetical protein
MRTIKTYSKGAPFYIASSPKKVAAKLFNFQGDAKPLSSAPVWAEPSQLLIGLWSRAPQQSSSRSQNEAR